MSTLVVEIGTGDSFNETAEPAAAAAEVGNATCVTTFSDAFREEQVIMAMIVKLLIHDITDIDYHMLVVPREHLCKAPSKSLFCAITCLILFLSSLSHNVTSLPLILFWMSNFTHLSLGLNKVTT